MRTTYGFQFGLYDVVVALNVPRSISIVYFIYKSEISSTRAAADLDSVCKRGGGGVAIG